MRKRAMQMLNKVPEVTLYFWIIKIMCTTVGETAADFLNADLHFGLTGTSLVMSVILAIFLALQLRSKKYVPLVVLGSGGLGQYRRYTDYGQSGGQFRRRAENHYPRIQPCLTGNVCAVVRKRENAVHPQHFHQAT